MSETPSAPERSYGCSMGCGNPYDFILVVVQDGSTMFLCFPCYVRNAMDGLKAVIETDDPMVKAALEMVPPVDSVPMNSGRVRSRGHNAPADADSDDIIEAFDAFLTEDEVNEQLGIGPSADNGVGPAVTS